MSRHEIKNALDTAASKRQSEPSEVQDGQPPEFWWIDHGSYGNVTMRRDEAERAAGRGLSVHHYEAGTRVVRDGQQATVLDGKLRRLVEVIADKIEDGTLFKAGIYSRSELAGFVRRALLAAPQCQLPQGWMMVPVEPTLAMCDALRDRLRALPRAMYPFRASEAYKAALYAIATPRAVARDSWQPITAPGQVSIGDKLRFTIGDGEYRETVKAILDAGTDREELIYNKRRNFYLITSMAMENKGSQKNVRFKRAALAAQREGGAA